jgi:hypothetical protein
MRIFGLLCVIIAVAALAIAGRIRLAPRFRADSEGADPASFFPSQPGFVWIYDGFAEYSHRMTLNEVTPGPRRGETVHKITGEVEDPSGGESPHDFRIELEYVFSRDSATERVIRGDVFPHLLRPLVVLRHPIETGRSWSVDAPGGGKIEAGILEVGVDPEDERRFCIVRYTAPAPGLPGGRYVETRTFKQGLGITRFENTIAPEVDFNYFLAYYSLPGRSPAPAPSGPPHP